MYIINALDTNESDGLHIATAKGNSIKGEEWAIE